MPDTDDRPNLVFIMSDDHARHAIGAYGSRINQTPNLDRIATGGMRFDNAFCTNSICTPSRASILTGTYNHVNGVTTLNTPMDNTLETFPKLMQEAGYQTAMFGKWHLGEGPEHEPTGFDKWSVLPGQGRYHDPVFLTAEGENVIEGYVTGIVTDMTLDWIRRRDPDKPFAVMSHHKAPHHAWEPDEKHANMYDGATIPEPETFWDDYATRSPAATAAKCRMMDLKEMGYKVSVPDGLSESEEISWRYQDFIKDYLRCIASIDDNVGRILDYLEENGLAENTIIVYTSDQGFFLGDHGWFDKRFMYEESLTMPLLIRYPGRIAAGTVCSDFVLNVDFAPTFLELAGIAVPSEMQGSSFLPLLGGETAHGWQTSMYYRYWMHRDGAHNIWAHYGVRTHDHKLIYFYNDPMDQPGAFGPVDPPSWELYDLSADPFEINNVYGDPEYADVELELKEELARLQLGLGDEAHPSQQETRAEGEP
ncbi:MAG: sulfatase [Acidimicrobiia bacterium]|nr:MAG: sulfatase [Acidimicrobiia bacterium]